MPDEIPSNQKLDVSKYIMGLGPDKKKHSIQETADILKISTSTVKKKLKWNVDYGILKRRGPKNPPIYTRGPKYFILEDYVRTGFAVATSPIHIKSDYYYSIHGYGRFPMFVVKKEGKTSQIDTLNPEERDRIISKCHDARNNPPDLSTKLFDMDKPVKLKGSLEYTSSISLSNDDSMRFNIAYRVAKNISYLTIYPESKLYVSPDDAKNVDAMIQKTMERCRIVLDLFSKNGWEFEKDECGNYVLYKPLTDENFHRVMEGPVSEFILDNSPKKYGCPQSRISIDTSSGPREVEVYSPDIIELLDQLPELFNAMKRLESAIPEGTETALRDAIGRLENQQCVWAEQINTALENTEGNRMIFFPNQLNIYLIRGEQ